VTLVLWCAAAAFALGLLFGSFLNVCISRLPRRESIVSPRSRCPECSRAILWHDNIPLLSWFLLRGRCRSCNQPISLRYPVVELITGVWFASVVLRFVPLFAGVSIPLSTESYVNLWITGLNLCILGFLLIGLIVMDWQTMVLPDAFTLSGIAIALFLICVRAIFLAPNEDQVLLARNHIQLTSPGGVIDTGNLFLTGPENLIFGRIAAICGAALLLLLIRWLYKAVRHREGMGLGDVKLLAMIAAFLGFWPAVLALFFGVLIASFYGVFLLARGRASSASKLAFGSFLAIGGLITAQFGHHLIDMYSALFR
jgi:leader peptidase (prepilin peptidase)/N-methyltransferase